ELRLESVRSRRSCPDLFPGRSRSWLALRPNIRFSCAVHVCTIAVLRRLSAETQKRQQATLTRSLTAKQQRLTSFRETVTQTILCVRHRTQHRYAIARQGESRGKAIASFRQFRGLARLEEATTR